MILILCASAALLFVCLVYLVWRAQMQAGSVVQVGRIPVNLEEEFASDPRMQQLMLAAVQGRSAELKALVQAGVDPEQPGDFYRLTPLMWTVMHGNSEGVLMLLELGVNPNVRVSRPTKEHMARALGEMPGDHEGQLRYGRRRERIDAFGGESALSFALRKRRLDLMELLLQNGADPNIQGRIDPVMFDAVEIVHGEVSPALRLLIQYGANPDLTAQPDGRGASAVDWFTFSGNMASAIYLIEQGADPARTLRYPMPGVTLPNEKLTEENSVPWNSAAATVQRFMSRNPDPESRIYRLKTLMVERGVRFPVFDPHRPTSLEPRLTWISLEYVRHISLPDHDIERTIEYHTRNNSLSAIGSLAEDYQRYREAKDGQNR
ncbi:MAG: ankyrin repeat domain-containing protein [Aquimonas sp.]|nr:ankyrin repeat domain-containing protein [Aquimonas sp.]